tara:strand:+ start:160 stop:957 length:798 start_codon:yes stop_codon:yes gene_type:complete
MKFFIVAILITNIYSQCDILDELNCNHPMHGEGCEWIENIQSGSCSSLSGDECNVTSGCSWDYECFEYGWWYNWCYEGGYVCNGGNYTIDNSYCQEIEMPECSELDELNCNHPLYGDGCEWIENDINCENISSESLCDSNNCDWIEDIEYGNCSNYNNSSSCDSAHQDCYWDLCYGGYYGSWSHCCRGGAFEIDNNYCDGESYFCNEIEFETGDVNQDYLVNVADVIFIINLVITNNYLMEADLNHDYTIDVTDIILTVNIILER